MLGEAMIGYWINRMLDKMCGLLYPSDISGQSDDYWFWEEWDE